MKRGYKGYRAGCCDGFGIWGVSINCPNPVPSEHSEFFENDPGRSVYTLDPSGLNKTTSRGFAYNARAWNNKFGLQTHKDVLPELWESTGTDIAWHVFAAKLPTSYPGVACEKYPVISSATDGGDGTWEADLGTILEIETYASDDPDAEQDIISARKGYGFILRSRAIYLDGLQAQVAYSTYGKYPSGTQPSPDGDQLAGSFITTNPPTAGGGVANVFGDTFIINILDPTDIREYPTATLNHNINTPFGADPTFMEAQFKAINSPSSLLNILGSFGNWQYPANSIYLGQDYGGLSSYNPVSRYGGSVPWGVARLKYDDQRVPSSGGFESGIDCFSTYGNIFSSDLADLGKPDTTYAGDYIIALFSVRCYKDSSLVTEENPDEPYVAAFHKDTFLEESPVTKIICSQWTSKRYRPVAMGGHGDEGGMDGYGDGTGVADGTLSDTEAAAGEVIVDAANPPVDYPDETFPNPRIWCYNRVWDSVEKQNVNLLLVTTLPDDPPTASDVVSDFEQPDGYDPDYLDNGLIDAKLHWETGGQTEGEKWFVDSTDAINGTYSARCQEADVTKESDIDIWISFSAMTAGDITLKYIHDNRWYGTRVEPFVELTNFPDPDNSMSVLLDGGLVPINIDSANYETSFIDNVSVPEGNPNNDPAFYTTARLITITVTAGTHTLRIRRSRRFQDNGHLRSQIDDVSFGMEVLVGDDADGSVRWYYDGYQFRKLEDWTWAARDDEGDNPTNISSRAETKPHFITMDGKGRILIGNPHYVMRRLRDGTLDPSHGKTKGKGFLGETSGWARWTASPNIEQPPPTCLDPDSRYVIDLVSDTKWGGMQILSVGDDTYQVRGMNGSLARDTTHDPIDRELWTYRQGGKVNHEVFSDISLLVQTGGDWARRAHSWTVSDNGTVFEPHVEVIWRPTMHQPAWPGEGGTTDAERFPHPPYRSDFSGSTTLTEWSPESTRWRDPRQITDGNLLRTGTIFEIRPTGDPEQSILVVSDVPIPGPETGNTYLGRLLKIFHDGESSSCAILAWSIADEGEGGIVGLLTIDTRTLAVGAEVGDEYEIYDSLPRWALTNMTISRTYSDAWSRIPQPAWVRATNDGPADPEDPSYWDPDWSESLIADMQATVEGFEGFGGPFGSAVWVMVQARFNPTGFRYMSYMYDSSIENVCAGHGPDEADNSPVSVLAAIQRANLTQTSGMTDFDAIPCDCGCC